MDDFERSYGTTIDHDDAETLALRRACRHKHIVLIGNEETGLRSIRCEDCGQPMTRRTENGQYVYEPR